MASKTRPLVIEREIVIDTRERTPWFSEPVPGFTYTTRRGTLRTADYTLSGLQDRVLVERKSIGDLLGCIGFGRKRFVRELQRMSEETEQPWLIIEGSRRDIEERRYRGRIFPSQVIGSLQSWAMDYGVRIWFASTPRLAARDALRLFKRIENRVLVAGRSASL